VLTNPFYRLTTIAEPRKLQAIALPSFAALSNPLCSRLNQSKSVAEPAESGGISANRDLL